jgi:GNAT superfamily N-acetyltransferase
MITLMMESVIENAEELQRILPLHYEELALNKDKVPLSPIWEQYFEMERSGVLVFAAARENGELVGYFIGFVKPNLHYSTCLTCSMDIFYIHPDHRGNRTGIKLFQFVEKELKKRGVQRWFVGSKLHKDCGKLFEYLKFTAIETYYSKWICD